MTCANHPEAVAAAYCRTCGKPLCTECKREAEGTIYCAEHVPVAAANAGPASSPYTTTDHPVPPPNAYPYTAPQNQGGPIPFLAFLLGFIPGVGAIYNGQYAKGLIHAVVFGILVSILGNYQLNGGRHPAGLEPLMGILLAAWVFYMAFEAYHTAKSRRDGFRGGEDVSSLLQMDRSSGRFPVGALVLIVIGGVLLLDTTGLISIDRLLRLWPLGLILVGAYLLYERMTPAPRAPEARDDRR